MGLRRLSQAELDAALCDLLSECSPRTGVLPNDARTPFDNDELTQNASDPFVTGLSLVARELTDDLLADEERLRAIVGCDFDESDCPAKFAARVGRRFVGRALTAAEVGELASLVNVGQYAKQHGLEVSTEASTPGAGYTTALMAMIQHPEFLYFIPTPHPESGEILQLNSSQLAKQLAYFITGRPPGTWLLDRVDAGALKTDKQIREVAVRLLSTDAAQKRVARFFAMWLTYESLDVSPQLIDAMHAESEALIRRIIFEQRRPWIDIFRSEETYVSDLLAKNYGLPSPGPEPKWVRYANPDRRGLFSHASFLGAASEFEGDTSPVRRGILIREQLLCQDIPPPPPTVEADVPPASADMPCKVDRLAAHRQGTCAGCHSLMDPIGHGLEQFDIFGKFRETEPGKAECKLDGEGEITEFGKFSGPRGLAELLINEAAFKECAVTNIYRFAMGHRELDRGERDLVARISAELPMDFLFDDLILKLVTSDAFRNRRALSPVEE